MSTYDAIETVNVDHNGAEYTVKFFHDYDAECPLGISSDEPIGYYVWERRYSGTDVLQNNLDQHGAAGTALEHFIDIYGASDEDKVTRAFSLWRAITGSDYALITGSGHGYSQGDEHSYYCIVEPWEYAGAVIDSHESVTSWMDEYSSWRYGNTWYLTVENGDGADVESIGGLIGDTDSAYIVETYMQIIEGHYGARVEDCNRVGAGFIGVI